jgi:TatD DNase family protein
MQYYDCHTHINHDPLVQNADTIAEACLKQGIILNDVGTNLETSALAIAHAQKHENVYAIVGIHPNDTHKTSLSLVITQLTK